MKATLSDTGQIDVQNPRGILSELNRGIFLPALRGNPGFGAVLREQFANLVDTPLFHVVGHAAIFAAAVIFGAAASFLRSKESARDTADRSECAELPVVRRRNFPVLLIENFNRLHKSLVGPDYRAGRTNVVRRSLAGSPGP